ncbi:hypothetical protein [Aureivirga marina]|uniref:hypothetical protein n=1 Tax=Aureivirga marina TaxID=1182451 RepID=UPI0018CBBE89|nr:hypothetical protein [Aureivirga marina]
MEQQFSLKQKKILVIVVMILLLLLCYKRIFSDTISMITSYQNLLEKKVDINTLNQKEVLLENSLYELNAFTGNEEIADDLIQQKILSFTSDFNEEKISIVNLNSSHIFHSKDFKIITNSLEIEGNYKALISYLYYLEKNFNDSQLVKVTFEVKKDHVQKKEKLYATLLFQNYKPI